MAATAKAEEPDSRVLVLRTGEKMPVFAEDGRFYYCGTTRFRKTNADVLKVETVRASKEDTDAREDSGKPQNDAETAE